MNWPTPAVFDTTGGPYPTQLTEKGFRSFHNGVPHGSKLSDAVRAETGRPAPTAGLPAPDSRSSDGNPPGPRPRIGKLNPNWVEALMGLPMGWTEP
jgi:hypothetical protein